MSGGGTGSGRNCSCRSSCASVGSVTPSLRRGAGTCPDKGAVANRRVEHGGTGGCRGAPRSRRDLDPAAPPGSGESARRPEPVMAGWLGRQVPVERSRPARQPDGRSLGDWAAATSNGPSERPCTPGADVAASLDLDTTGTDPADPPDEQPTANTALRPPHTPPGYIAPQPGRPAPRPPESCALPHTAGHARSDE
jgi:hypothetical protein